ncbi:MAG: hypothetical protein R3C19_02385 [Planctomycetaceae bacterium]
MAPVGPVIADVRISINDRAYRTWLAEFLATKLDTNGDGSLSATEIDLIPQRLRDQINIQSASQIVQQITGVDAADDVSPAEFSSWFSERLSRSFDVIAEAVSAAEAVRLAGLIDQNDDGRIAEDELAQGTRTLRFRDLDDDETFSVSELMPFRDPRNQQAAVVPEVANLPFVQLTDEDAVARTATRLLKRYGDGERLPVSSLRLPPVSLPEIDADADGMLTEPEVRAFLTAPVFHLAVDVLLSDRSGASRVSISPVGTAAEFCRVEQSRRDRASMLVDDMPIEIRSRGGAAQNRSILTRFLGQHFSVADADKSSYVDETEFSGLAGPLSQAGITADFAAMDFNSDGMITRDELRGFVERDTIAMQSHIEVSVRQDGKTLFKLLDGNVDRRLTPREFRDGFASLLEYDLNQDGQLAESELGTQYVLQIGLGQPQSLRTSATNMMMNTTDAVLPGTSRLDGPEWFRRMDRNQDGDVSSREFPGTRAMFEQLDKNADGLVSADEADLASGS